jgi:hypothetical protein
VTIVIVGHGPSPVGKGWGAEIDRHIVVRAHNWEWQGAADYGSRCDYGILPGPWFKKAVGEIVRPPSTGWLMYQSKRGKPLKPPAEIAGARVLTHSLTFLHDRLAPHRPTRGLAGFVMAALQFSGIDRDFVLIGLDRMRTGEFTPHAPDCQTYRAAVGKGDTPADVGVHHSSAKERDVLREFAAAHGLRLRFEF